MSKPQKKDPPTCPICLTHYTSVIRQPIQCPYCPASACRQCTSQYLLTSLNNPHCLACKREWNREFIDTNLTQTYRKGPLKQHRKAVLIDREKGRLPAMQVFLEARIEYDAAEAIYVQVRRRRIQTKRQRDELQKLHAATDTQEQLAERLAPINRERAELRIQRNAAHERMVTAQHILTGRQREVRQFIMKCPSDDCRGFLSTAWKCGVCQKFYCTDCHAEKPAQKDEEHVCNPDAKATAAMIKQETKPCPKCGIRISKIDGCFAKDTPILLWDGNYRNAQDIKVGDVLVGDDGEKRVVEELCSGGDEMFEVTQGKGMSYTVNSKHKLALKFSGDDEVIEITVDDYMKLPEYEKSKFMGFKVSFTPWISQEKGFEIRTGITVNSVGQGTYYGWSVSGSNRRFLLADFTVARNCDQMWCISCQTTFSWNTGQILVNTVVHNPHYYEYLRRTNNGVIPREAGDVPCGGLPNAYALTRLVMALPRLTQEEKTELLDILRCLSDIQYVRLPQFPLQRPANVNQELDIRYLMKEVTEEEWGTILERGESKADQKKEIGLILQTLIHIGSEKMAQLQNSQVQTDQLLIARSALQELRNVRDYTNKSLKDKGLLMGMVVPKITKDWRWMWVRRSEMKSQDTSSPEGPHGESHLTGSNARGEVKDDTKEEVEEEAEAEAEAEEAEEDKIMVDFGDELVEMTISQAQQLAHLRPIGNV